ncbi:MAG: SLC26A/SulP transporter family protein [Gammaproteobacteria bacterium]|nr:SLC26A/SulP transporter family protein [Gammaproteobacteria bacterium]
MTETLLGIMTGAINVVSAASLSALIFTDGRLGHLAQGISLALVSATVIGLIVSIAGSCRFTIATPQDRTAPILAIMAAAIVAAAPTDATSDQIFLDVVTAIVAATLVTGAFLMLLGLSRAGGLMRFIPYSVLGGFFAGTGWLLVLGGLRVMISHDIGTLSALSLLTDPGMLARWLPGLCMAAAILITFRFTDSAFALPLLLLAGIALFFAIAHSQGENLSTLGDAGWLLGPFEQTTPGGATVDIVDLVRHDGWSIVVGQWSNVATILVISAISILLTASALELLSQQDIDVNRELLVAGLANLAAGLGAGMVGFQSVGMSSLALKTGVRSRATGVLAALTCGLVLWIGVDMLAYLPRVVLGGILLWLGLSFLGKWLIGTWGTLPRGEYLVVPLILGIIATVGFIEGMLAGLLAALVLFVLNYSRTQVVRFALSGQQLKSTVERNIDDERYLNRHGGQLLGLKLRGYLFFGTATQLLYRVRERVVEVTPDPVRYVLLDFEQVTGIDSSTTYAFHRLQLLARKHDLTLLLTALSPQMRRQLDVARAIDDDGRTRTFASMDLGLEWYENRVIGELGQGRARTSATIIQHLANRFRGAIDTSALLDYLDDVSFPAGHVLIRQGDVADDLYFLEQGEVSVYVRTTSGNDMRIRRTGSGTVIGELGFYLGTPRSATVITDRPGRAYHLTQRSLQRMESEHPELASALHRFIAELLADRLLGATRTIDAVLT